MIRVSTRGRYALRAMVELASRDGHGPVARSDIAERQGISSDYVAQLFRPLQDAGLVEGVKGPGGGYRLTREPDKIGVRDVVEAVEGPVVLAPCLGNEGVACPRADRCPTRRLWEGLSLRIRDILDSYTLEDLLSEAEAPSWPVRQPQEASSDTRQIARFGKGQSPLVIRQPPG